MNSRFVVFVLFAIVLPASAANFSGKWLLTRQGGGRGQPPVVVTLNQVGAAIGGSIEPPRGNSTGSPANVDVLNGKADGDAVSFYIWTGLDRPVKNLYQGKLNGDEIAFTVTLDPPPQTGQRTFQVMAKRIQ